MPPDNKYQSTKPINTVIAGEHRFAGNYALWMVLNPHPPSHTDPPVCNVLPILWFSQQDK